MSDNMSCMLKSEPADHLKAINYFKKACDGEIAEGCHRYSSTMLTGIKGVVEVSLFLIKNLQLWTSVPDLFFAICLPSAGRLGVDPLLVLVVGIITLVFLIKALDDY